MRKGWLWVTVIGLLVLFIVVAVVLYLLGGPDQSALERIMNITVIFLGLSAVLVVLLVGALVGVLVWVALRVKDTAIPLLEQLIGTISRARGTTEFVSEEVARPIISFYSRVAGIRALIKTVTGRKRN